MGPRGRDKGQFQCGHLLVWRELWHLGTSVAVWRPGSHKHREAKKGIACSHTCGPSKVVLTG